MARPVKTSNTPDVTTPSSPFTMEEHEFRPLGEDVSVSAAQDLLGQLHLGKCLQRGQWLTSAQTYRANRRRAGSMSDGSGTHSEGRSSLW